VQHVKLTQIVHDDFTDYSGISVAQHGYSSSTLESDDINAVARSSYGVVKEGSGPMSLPPQPTRTTRGARKPRGGKGVAEGVSEGSVGLYRFTVDRQTDQPIVRDTQSSKRG
jgi:hypothetical protein